MTRLFSITLTAIFAIAVVSAQSFRPADITKAQSLRGSAQYIHAGKAQSNPVTSGGSEAPSTVGAKLLIWSDQKYVLPGGEIKIRAMGLASDATQLQVFITEQMTNSQGLTGPSSNYFCECGDGNGGYIASLTGFNFITLLTKKVAPGTSGRFDFWVNVEKIHPDGSPESSYQSTHLTVFALLSTMPENNPVVINQMFQTGGDSPVLLLAGDFPINVPLYYFSGAVPFEGALSTNPSVVSGDGHTLAVPATTGVGMEGRVVLMLPDGSFSTTSPQTYVPSFGNFPRPSQ